MREIRPPTGSKLNCKGWVQEAAYRMIQHNLHPDVAEKPDELIVYGGIGKAARNWDCFDAILKSLTTLRDTETLLVQSGKPVAVLPSHKDAPRVLIANSNLVPQWANWEHFRELDKKGLMMFGQMTAGSWIYIGTQGILQGTYETFVSAGEKHFGGDLSGRWILTAGLGGMGGAQPLAATFAGASCLAIEVDPHRIQRRLETGYVDDKAETLSEALDKIRAATEAKKAISVALLGNAADLVPEIAKGDFLPDLVTDQTSAHDPLNGYIPQGMTLESAAEMRQSDPKGLEQKAIASIGEHMKGLLTFKKAGIPTFDYGNNIRAFAEQAGVEDAFLVPGFVPEYIRPLFCDGKGPFRWVALSGDPQDIHTTDEALKDAFPEDKALCRWLDMAQEKVHFQGLPSRICWLGYKDREKAGLIFNDLVNRGDVSAPIVIGRDHLDCGSVASPNRETEAMQDGSDAVADWPILNALINSVNGASWVSFHHGGGVGMGYSLHSGMVIVADGTDEAAERLSRVLNSDPAMGIIRHADAGYERAQKNAREMGVRIPMMK